MLCQYKNILGEPGKGVHFHVFRIAVIDLLITILFALIVSKIYNWNFWVVFLPLIFIGILLHRFFCVNTTVNKLIFGNV